MNYFVFLPASEARNLQDNRRSVYKSDYIDIRLRKNKMSDGENELEEQLEKTTLDNDSGEEEEEDEGRSNYVVLYCWFTTLLEK